MWHFFNIFLIYNYLIGCFMNKLVSYSSTISWRDDGREFCYNTIFLFEFCSLAIETPMMLGIYFCQKSSNLCLYLIKPDLPSQPYFTIRCRLLSTLQFRPSSIASVDWNNQLIAWFSKLRNLTPAVTSVIIRPSG